MVGLQVQGVRPNVVPVALAEALLTKTCGLRSGRFAQSTAASRTTMRASAVLALSAACRVARSGILRGST
jgi:hypothetical protein